MKNKPFTKNDARVEYVLTLKKYPTNQELEEYYDKRLKELSVKYH